MSTVLNSVMRSVAGYTSGKYYNYKVEIILNSQNTSSTPGKSNITIKTYQNTGNYPNTGYSGNGFIKFALLGHTSKSTTETEWVAPIKMSHNNTAHPPDWEEIEDLRYTATFTHKADGTLTIYATADLRNTGSVHAAAPKSDKIECVATVPAILPGDAYTALDQPVDWTTCNASSDNDGTYMSFTFTPATGVDHHTLKVTTPETIVMSERAYESGLSYRVTNKNQQKLFAEMDRAQNTVLEATAVLKSYDENDTFLGTDTKTFKIIGGGMDVRVNGVWQNGIAWVYVGDEEVWKPGIVWVKVNGTWKKGIGLSDE